MLALVTALMCSLPTMAKTRNRQLITLSEDEESVLLPESVKDSEGRDIVVERSKAV